MPIPHQVTSTGRASSVSARASVGASVETSAASATSARVSTPKTAPPRWSAWVAPGEEGVEKGRETERSELVKVKGFEWIPIGEIEWVSKLVTP